MAIRATILRSVILFSGLAFTAAAQPVLSPLQPAGAARDGVQQLVFSNLDYEKARVQSEIVILGLPRGSGQRIDLTLQRMSVFADDAKIVVASPQGEHEIERPDVQFFTGSVLGDPSSRVFLALSPHGTSGTISAFGETSIISSGPGGLMPTVIYETSSPAAQAISLESPVCSGGLTPPGHDQLPPVGNILLPQSGVCRVYRLALDCDTEFTANLFGGNQTNASAYVATLVAGMTDMYKRDVNIMFQIGYLRLWIGEDPYTQAGAGDQLGEFRTYWINNMAQVSRNLTHLLSGRGLGGGVAWVSQVCTDYSYATSANLAGYFPYPLQNNRYQNWDIMVFAHETGHNVGSGHTHDINAYNPIIDGCGNGDCTVGLARMGTIMSYCHTCSGGMVNIRVELGPRVAAAIRAFLDTQPSCGTVPSITIFDQPRSRTVCRNASARFTVNAIGTPPLTYQWRHNNIEIPGANSALYIVAQATAATEGNYNCIINSSCVSASSNPGVLTVCAANFNCDFAVDFFDYLDYVDAFTSQNPSADFNGDSVIDFFDYLDFVDAFSAGC